MSQPFSAPITVFKNAHQLKVQKRDGTALTWNMWSLQYQALHAQQLMK